MFLYRRVLILLMFLLISFASYTQNIDSIENILSETVEKKKADILLKYAKQFTSNKPELSAEYLKRAIVFICKFPNEKKRGEAYSLAGKAQYYLANYDSALADWRYALKIFTDIKYDAGIAEQYNNIGVWYYSAASDYDNALDYYLLSLKKREEIKDSSGIASSLINIGNIYYKQNRRDKAIESFEKALYYAKAVNDKKEMSILLNNLGAEYAYKNDQDKALSYYLKSAEIKKELGSNTSLAVTYGSIGSLYNRKKDYKKALEYYNNALQILEKSSNKNYKSLIYNYISIVYKENGNFRLALDYVNKSQEIAIAIKDKSIQQNNYKEFSEIYALMNNFKKAYQFQQKFMQIRDSIFNEESDKRMKETEVKYASEKKNKENEILKRQQQINELELEKNTNRMYYLIASSAILFLLLLVIFSRYRFKQKTNKKLEEANTKLLISENNLKETVNTKDKFFSIIAHDLRNPLSSLTLISQLLDENPEGYTREQINHYVKSINNTANNLTGLVENLLYWARTQTSKISYNPDNINLYDIVSQNINLLKTNTEKKKLKILNLIEENTFINADINLITTVIRNLFANAVKFTEENGTVSFSVNEKDDFYEVLIQDTGIGMTDEDLKKLFRIDIDTKKIGNSSEKGTGLGLILCKEFIEKCGGKIKAESKLGECSKFSFTVRKGVELY